MDHDEDVDPSNDASWAHCSTKSANRFSHTSPSPVIISVSPAHNGEQFGYIYLTPGEREHQETVQAFFNSAGREVTTLPCPDFEEFLLANSLRTFNISFLCDLPEYILRLGRQILKDTAYSSDGRPDLSWLPRSPSATSPSLLSRGHTHSASHPANVMTRARPPQPSRAPVQPDPDRITPLLRHVIIILLLLSNFKLSIACRLLQFSSNLHCIITLLLSNCCCVNRLSLLCSLLSSHCSSQLSVSHRLIVAVNCLSSIAETLRYHHYHYRVTSSFVVLLSKRLMDLRRSDFWVLG